ncbi:PAS domain-containing protein [Erythrobacter sp.]|uniref:PAS domain-containing protein n=1 Tax=Erythrobacter sp. TaxID=1042 RepID=UPI002ED490FA
MNLPEDSIMRNAPFALTISDPHIDDNPLVFVSDAFEQMTGYQRSAVIGRNCRFLQGEQTDPETVKKIADAVSAGDEIEVEIYNYRADGEGFWNRLMVGPMRGEDGDVRFFVGLQHDLGSRSEVSAAESVDEILAEIQHRVKNHLSMVVGMIRIQARDKNARDSFDSLARRVEALQMLYTEMSVAGAIPATANDVPLGAYLTRISSAISHIDGRGGIRVLIDADKVDVPTETAARAGLVFSEILTNALQHAFVDRDEGVVEARMKMLTSGVVRLSVMDDGIGLPEDCDWPNEGNLGGRIVRSLLNGMGANLAVERLLRGTKVNVDIPLDRQEELIETAPEGTDEPEQIPEGMK